MFAPLPTAFAFLATPAWSRDLVGRLVDKHGLREAPGGADNPVILSWATLIGANAYKHDVTPWCGLAMGYAATRAQVLRQDKLVYPKGNAALWALNWADAGEPSDKTKPMFGDIGVLQRKDARGKVIGGHVTAIVAVDGKGNFWGLGGNQGDALNIKKFPLRSLYAVRSLFPGKVNAPRINALGDKAGKLV